MNKKVVKIINILLVVMAIVSIATNVFALEDPTKIESKPPEDGSIPDVAGQILGILQTVGIVLSVLVLVILGIKYMMASVEEKAEYKKAFIPYIVGAALIFAAPIFANAVYQFFHGMGK